MLTFKMLLLSYVIDEIWFDMLILLLYDCGTTMTSALEKPIPYLDIVKWNNESAVCNVLNVEKREETPSLWSGDF